MQFGHHNHDYNYQEHYLIVRPTLDLHPGAARRVYFDISVAPDARPGEYAGAARVLDASGKALRTVPLVLEVLPIDLQKPPVWFACNIAHPRLKEYGFNTVNTSYDDAVKNGYAGFIASMSAGGVRFKDKAIHWSNLAANRELLAPILQAGRDGTGPRGFFGGIAPDTYSNPKAAEVSARFFGGILRDFPQLDVLGRTVPAYYFRENRTLFQFPHEWGVLSGPPIKDDPALMDADRKAGKPFWYIDGMRHSKEQAARFTFGLWLWRSGAAGRFTTLAAVLQYGGGTARQSYPIEPYYTLLDVTTCNVDRALKESLVEGILNPCRDLILLRAGIDDYRYIHTLEAWLQRTEARQSASPALPAARKFRDELWASLSLDLTESFRGRSGAYGETLYPAPDFPWTPERFARTRRQVADHIVALRKAMGE
jgi:hypothetical protein